MGMWFHDRRIAIPIIFGILIGMLFGHFLGNVLFVSDAIPVINPKPTATIYLLQTEVHTDEKAAHWAEMRMRELGFETIVVKEFSLYYLYHAVALNPSSFNPLIKRFENKGIPYQVKRKRLDQYLEPYYDETDSHITKEIAFYLAIIHCYIERLAGKPISLNDEVFQHLTAPQIELVNQLYLLETTANTPLYDYYKLYVYKALAEILM